MSGSTPFLNGQAFFEGAVCLRKKELVKMGMKLLPLLNAPLPAGNPFLAALLASPRARLTSALAHGLMIGLLGVAQFSLRAGAWDMGFWFVLANLLGYALSCFLLVELALNPQTRRIPFFARRTWGKYLLLSFGIFALGQWFFLLLAGDLFPLLHPAAAAFARLARLKEQGWGLMVKLLPFWMFFAGLYGLLLRAEGLPRKREESLQLNLAGKVMRVRPDELLWATSEEHYLRIRLRDETEVLMVKMKLSDLLEQLPEPEFLQIHRSHLVNLTQVKSLSKKLGQVELSGGRCLPVSRRRWKQVVEAWNRLQGA